ncbi:MAG: Mur ligase domain-containing protein, partial [Bdellovibrionales bacterium]|nr:Mur ligase domain-containing protein [Bdellovibrionales bacterium]
MANTPTSSNESAPDRPPVKTIDLKPGAHVHFMGICGTAMASLAGLLHSRGFKVTGSD